MAIVQVDADEVDDVASGNDRRSPSLLWGFRALGLRPSPGGRSEEQPTSSRRPAWLQR